MVSVFKIFLLLYFPHIHSWNIPALISPINRIGVATPLMALRLGHHVALLSPYSDLRIELVVSDTNNVLGGGLPSSTTGVNDRRGDSWKELCIVIAFVVSTILIFIPLFVAADRKWSYLTYTGLLEPLRCLFYTSFILVDPHSKSPYIIPTQTFIQNLNTRVVHRNPLYKPLRRFARTRWCLSSLEIITIEHISTLSNWNIRSQHTGYVWQDTYTHLLVHFDIHIITDFLIICNPLIYTIPIHTYTLPHTLSPTFFYMLGTWILAVLIIISKFIVPYNDSALQGLLYALIVGFCGCLTTVSTLVHEIDSLEIAPSYIYGIATNLVAQIGLILIYNVYAYYYYVKGNNTSTSYLSPVISIYSYLCHVNTIQKHTLSTHPI